MFAVTTGFIHNAPSVYTFKDGWKAWEFFCNNVRQGFTTSARYDGQFCTPCDYAYGTAEWHKEYGFKNHFFRA